MKTTSRKVVVVIAMVAALSACAAHPSRDDAVGKPTPTGSVLTLPSLNLSPTLTPSPAGSLPIGDASPTVLPLSIAARRAVVTRVVDGDTIYARLDSGVVEKVRFIGVDTPESTTRHEPYGKEASAYTRRLLDSATIWLETDAELRDRYGRLLAYVWLARPRSAAASEIRRVMVNALLVRDGYAQMATYPPNVRYVEHFRALQREAREANRGLWREGSGSGESGGNAAPKHSASRGGSCDPSYPDVCIPPPPPDLDCGDISHRRFRVLQPDPHNFDGNQDGIGCERG